MLMLLRRIAEQVGVAHDDHAIAALEAATDAGELTDEIAANGRRRARRVAERVARRTFGPVTSARRSRLADDARRVTRVRRAAKKALRRT